MRPGFLSIAIFLMAAAWAQAGQPASPRFKLEQATLGGSAAHASATIYRAGTTSSQAAIGASSSSRFVLQSGFWGHAGPGHVPIQLRVGKTAGTEVTIELSWSGYESLFDVYRSEDCASTLAHYFDSTVQNHYSDAVSPGLHCYLVTPAGSVSQSDRINLGEGPRGEEPARQGDDE